jgi:hypothetical protein
MSVLNSGGIVSYGLGSVMMQWLGITENHFDSLWLLIIITNCSSLIPIFLIKWLPDGKVEINNGQTVVNDVV